MSAELPVYFHIRKKSESEILKLLILEYKKGGGKMYFITKKGVGGQ